jgi:hypothetical protein
MGGMENCFVDGGIRLAVALRCGYAKNTIMKEKPMSPSQTRTIGGVVVYVPTGAIETDVHVLATRLQTLRGARIGVLDNRKEFADIVLRGIADKLHREHGAQLQFWRKDYLGKPSPFAKEMAASCDAVINGVGH